MTIKDMVVQVDQTAASERRLEAAVKLSRHLGAHLTAVYLAAEPFVRRVSRLHLPDELVREYRRQAEAEADTVLSHVRRMVGAEVSVDAVMEIGPLDRLPVLFAHLARTADLAIVGEPDRDSGGTDDAALVEVSFMDTGRPALVLPQAGTQARCAREKGGRQEGAVEERGRQQAPGSQDAWRDAADRYQPAGGSRSSGRSGRGSASEIFAGRV